jgi:sirohydrochlorin cobaltochelatase
MTEEGLALVLSAHGSHEGPAPRRVTHQHADRLRATGAFEEVREAFWKTAPSVTDSLRACRSKKVVVVPLFMSEGYFVDEVIPREIEAAPTTDSDIKYTEPVGTHPSLTDTVLSRAEEEVRGEKEDVALAVVGHGTSRHSGSSVSAEEHASRLEDIFAEVGAVFLDEDPPVSEISDRFESDTVVAVPLFVADGPTSAKMCPMRWVSAQGRRGGR